MAQGSWDPAGSDLDGGLPDAFKISYFGTYIQMDSAGAVHDLHLAYDSTRQNIVGTDVISQYDHTVNSIGQRSAVAQVGTAFQAVRAIAWQYDSLGQVIQADSSENTHDRAYQYDTIGNRLQGSAGVPPASTETTYLPNALNQYQTITTGGAFLSPIHELDSNMATF